MIQVPEKFTGTIPLPENERLLLLNALQEVPPVSIRINPKKIQNDIHFEKVKWCSEGYYLAKRPVFTFDPVFHSGGYYVQEASSMIIGEIVRKISLDNSIKYALDLCAAPGGKSTHLLANLPENSLLFSNEVVPARVGALYENLMKWGNANSVITSNDPSHFSSFGNLFDLILVDAPCSGEGMFRKEEAAITEWSLKNVEHCSVRQKRILSDVLPALKPGGFLIYSTCTYNEKENEENVGFLTENYDMELFFPDLSGQVEAAVLSRFAQTGSSVFRFFPHQIKGEGLFVAVLRKKEAPFSSFRIKKSNTSKVTGDFQKYIQDFSTERFSFLKENNFIHLFPAEHSDLIENVRKKLHLIRVGIKTGEQKGKEFVPGHELLLSHHFDKNSWPSFEISYSEAIRYLQKEASFFISENKGWGYFSYSGIPLGFFKSVPGRINNYLPKELKIRMKYNESQRFSVFPIE